MVLQIPKETANLTVHVHMRAVGFVVSSSFALTMLAILGHFPVSPEQQFTHERTNL